MKSIPIYYYKHCIIDRVDKYISSIDKERIEFPLARVSLSNVFAKLDASLNDMDQVISMISELAFKVNNDKGNVFIVRLNAYNNRSLIDEFSVFVPKEFIYHTEDYNVVILCVKTEEFLGRILKRYIHCIGNSIILVNTSNSVEISDLSTLLGISRKSRISNELEAFVRLANEYDYALMNVGDSMIDILSRKYSCDILLKHISSFALKHNIIIEEEFNLQ